MAPRLLWLLNFLKLPLLLTTLRSSGQMFLNSDGCGPLKGWTWKTEEVECRSPSCQALAGTECACAWARKSVSPLFLCSLEGTLMCSLLWGYRDFCPTPLSVQELHPRSGVLSTQNTLLKDQLCYCKPWFRCSKDFSAWMKSKLLTIGITYSTRSSLT